MPDQPTAPPLKDELARVGDAIAGAPPHREVDLAAAERLDAGIAQAELEAEAEAALEQEHAAAADVEPAPTEKVVAILEAQGFATIRDAITSAALAAGQLSLPGIDAAIDRAGLALTQAKAKGDRQAEEAIFHDLRIYRAVRKFRVELGKLDQSVRARQAITQGIAGG